MKETRLNKSLIAKLLVLVMVISCAAFFTGCGDKKASKKADDELVIGLAGSTALSATVDPAKEWDGWYTVKYGVGETLFKINNDLDVEPWVAEKYENIDENTWKITIRDDAKFSNGEDVTAEKVQKSLERASSNPDAEFIKDVTFKADGKELTMTTKNPNPALIKGLVQPCTSIIDVDASKDVEKAPVCTGPYKFESFDPKGEVVVVANDEYAKKPEIKKITFKPIEDYNTATMALQSGEIDAAYALDLESAETLEKDENIVVEKVASSREYGIFFNDEKLNDVDIKKAILMGIDRDKICNDLLKGTATPAINMFPAESIYAGKDTNYIKFDKEGAEKLLDEAGWVLPEGKEVREKDGKPLTIKLATYKRIAQEQIATELQQEMKDLGIDFQIEVADDWEIIEKGDYDLCLVCNVTIPTGDPAYYMLGRFKEDGGLNYTHMNNPEMLAKAEQLAKTFDEDEQVKLVNEMQNEIAENAIEGYVGFNNLIMAHNNKVEGLELSPSDYYEVNGNLKIVK